MWQLFIVALLVSLIGLIYWNSILKASRPQNNAIKEIQLKKSIISTGSVAERHATRNVVERPLDPALSNNNQSSLMTQLPTHHPKVSSGENDALPIYEPYNISQ